MKPIDHLSFQLYSARTLQPLEQQFELLKSLGYKNVEPFGGLFADADHLKHLLQKYEMKAPTAHVGLDRLRADAAATSALCKELGIQTIFAPAPPMGERDMDAEGWRAFAKQLHGIGKQVQDAGLKFGWHNHHWEYGKASDGTTFLDIMFETAPELLWEPDVAWILRGGADPIKELGRYTGRVRACHVKDLAPAGECADEDGWADPGHGTMDWTALLAALRQTGCEHFVVEHDKPSDVTRFARRARETVASWS